MLSELRASQYCTCTRVRLIETINWESEVPEGNSLHASWRWLDGGNCPVSTMHERGGRSGGGGVGGGGPNVKCRRANLDKGRYLAINYWSL